MSSAAQRRRTIVDMVRAEGFVSTAELASRLQVSEMSIRRDAAALAEADVVSRVHGGLLAAPGGSPGEVQAPADLRRIAERAATLVGVDDVVMVDAGRTALALTMALPAGFRGTVISHSLPVLEVLEDRPEVTTIGLGGELYRRSRAFIGSAALTALEQLRATTFFMGAASVRESGIFAMRDVERELKLAMIAASEQVVVLTESAKFETAAPVFLVGWDERFSLVTDVRPPDEMVSALRRRGVRVIGDDRPPTGRA